MKFSVVTFLTVLTLSLTLGACSKNKGRDLGKEDKGAGVAPAIPNKGTETNKQGGGTPVESRYYVRGEILSAKRSHLSNYSLTQEVQDYLVLTYLNGGRDQLKTHTTSTCMQDVRVNFTFRGGGTASAVYIEFQNAACPASGLQTDEGKIKFAHLLVNRGTDFAPNWKVLNSDGSTEIGDVATVDSKSVVQNICDWTEAYEDTCEFWLNPSKKFFNSIDMK